MDHSIMQLHTYAITTVPPHINPEDVDQLAEANRLPMVRFKAISADMAKKTAMHTLRDPIHDVVRVEEVVQPA